MMNTRMDKEFVQRIREDLSDAQAAIGVAQARYMLREQKDRSQTCQPDPRHPAQLAERPRGGVPPMIAAHSVCDHFPDLRCDRRPNCPICDRACDCQGKTACRMPDLRRTRPSGGSPPEGRPAANAATQ